eukprot:GHUV01037026.1.p1 GENE.GHUV01037026.1~~GHUV01037026.1.p1  ORF type:complete len:159 (-),score=37.88 GHUV01037026.1:117-593(-)
MLHTTDQAAQQKSWCVALSPFIFWPACFHCRQPTFPVLKAMRTTVIFHLGSIALGSFIIAVIQFLRLLLEYVDKKTRQLQQQNKVAKAFMWLVRCLLWCLEKIVAFINRNAYILVAGEPCIRVANTASSLPAWHWNTVSCQHQSIVLWWTAPWHHQLH